MFLPTSPRPPRAMILQVSDIVVSLSGEADPADKGRMRPSRSSLATIALGLGVLGISLARVSHVAHTAFALFLAAGLLAALLEGPGPRPSPGPVPWAGFRLAPRLPAAALTG